jgi:hypothetical protein
MRVEAQKFAAFAAVAVMTALPMTACAVRAPVQHPRDSLYLAVELSENGRAVGSPKVLGFEGRRVEVRRRASGSQQSDYRLILRPEESGQGYRVMLDLETPRGRRQGRVGLLHGEERSIKLDAETQATVLLMRVDSPEFRALLAPRGAAARGTI